MKKGLNRDHQQQLQHHQNFNLPTSSFPFNNFNNQANFHHQQPRHHLYNNSIPQVQSQFTSLSLNSQNQQQQSPRQYQQHQQSRNTSSPNYVVIRPSAQSSSQPERWVPHSIKNVQHKSLGSEEPNQAIFRKVRGILNKLTPEKFDKLVDGLISLGLNSPSLLKGVILLIFEKALEEPKYSCMYAQLCKILSKELPNFEPPVPATDPPSNEPPINTFCKLLLIKCKDEFDKRLKATERFNNSSSTVTSSLSSGKNGASSSTKDSEVKLSDEEEEAKTIAKSKMLGNIKFICELGKQGLVHENILHLCIRQLVGKKREESFESKAQDLECLAQIMTTVGKMLDTEKARKLFDQYFERIEYYSKCPELPARIKFMLKDVMELRHNNWLPRRIQREVAPKTITQIREEAAKEGIMPNFWANQQLLTLMGGAPHGLNPHVLAGGSFPSIGFPGSGLRPTFSGPLFGHPHGLIGNQGQRALDDMGYYLGSGPGVFAECRSPVLNPSLQPGHMPYRGSNSQGNERVSRAGDGKQKISSSSGVVSQLPTANVPPRFRSKDGGQVAQINLAKGPAPPLNPNLRPQDGYFGPAKDSLVLNTYNSSSSPKKDHSARSSPVISEGGPHKVGQPAPVTDPMKLLLDCVEDIVTQFLDGKMLVDEVISRLKRLKVTKSSFSEVTCFIIKKALVEASTDKHREFVPQLLSSLHEKELIVRPGIVVSVVKQLLAQLTELEVNDPLIKTHLAEIISRSVAAEIISLKESFDLVKNYYPMFLLCLQHLKTIQGEGWLIQTIETSKINLMLALPETDQTKESLAEILEKRSLEFLQPLLRIESELIKLLLNNEASVIENGSGEPETDVSPAALSRWIKDNVDPSLQSNPGFIVIVVTCIVKSIMEKSKRDVSDGKIAGEVNSSPVKSVIDTEKEKLESYKKLLQSLLGSKARLQLAALYALQTVCYDMKFPKGLLVRWFNAFYEMEIVDEEVFFLWREQVTEEYPGKGQALFQVNAWLTWLEEEAEDDDGGDDEDENEEEDRKGQSLTIKSEITNDDPTVIINN